MKKSAKAILLIIVLFNNLFARDENIIIIAGPIASVSHPVLYMVQENVLKNL